MPAPSPFDTQPLLPHPQVNFAITVCFLISSVRQTHKNVCGSLCYIGCLADMLISASLPPFQYVDTQIENWLNSQSKYQNRKCSSQSTMKKLACIVRRGWLGTFWRGSWNDKNLANWETAVSIFNLQFKASNNGWIYFYFFYFIIDHAVRAMHFCPQGLHIVIQHN